MMPLNKFVRTETLNCFTGGISYIARNNERPISEEELMLCGTGFQFRSDFDEYGYPEFIFNVIGTSEVAISSWRGDLLKEYVPSSDSALAFVMQRLKLHPLIVWVNSRYMSYSDVYFNRDPYIHAIVLESYDETTNLFKLFDPLVMDRFRMEGSAFLPSTHLVEALTKTVKGNELAPEMGTAYTLQINNADFSKVVKVDQELLRQAHANITDPEHACAVEKYRRLCVRALKSDDAHARQAARRLFDHINVLFVVPSFTYLKGFLACSPPYRNSLEFAERAERSWRELSILALKFQATGRAELINQIDGKFRVISRLHDLLWKEIVARA
ncbi:hypothetical protein [Rhizobium sp. SJZ105]|uniref:hypothetical protein n=1 Tax=Rhizobium sp. SJZ105 TaxID=2572678 RepID=UPI0011AAC570|nr:hypothetical protein [Rhizobium sp. SJZ105]